MDDSKSMGENGCGTFALEALTLICRAMARLEVGELGVVRFGGGAGVMPLQVQNMPSTYSTVLLVMLPIVPCWIACLSITRTNR